MGLQVKEKAIDKGKWSGRARPRTSPAQVRPACMPLRSQLLQNTGSEGQSTVSAPPGAWVLLTAVPAALWQGSGQSLLTQMGSFTSGISWLTASLGGNAMTKPRVQVKAEELAVEADLLDVDAPEPAPATGTNGARANITMPSDVLRTK